MIKRRHIIFLCVEQEMAGLQLLFSYLFCVRVF